MKSDSVTGATKDKTTSDKSCDVHTAVESLLACVHVS